ncbi:MAG: gamma-glutamyltransferase, partial [Fidelibacterota bacterium]
MRIRRLFASVLIIGLLVPTIRAQYPDAVGRRGMVVSGNLMASRVGLSILRRGGNAIDAAVATGFALAVVEPRAGNIGGGGFMVIRFSDGRTTTIDFREKAPASATRDMYLDEQGEVIPQLSTTGILASGVPGAIRGFGLAMEQYGSFAWETVIEPAIELAEGGIAVSYQLHHDLTENRDRLIQFEETRRIFYPGDEPLRLNALFRQPDLAATLQRISTQGPDEFYTGETGRLLSAHMRQRGGLITMQDLADYRAVER